MLEPEADEEEPVGEVLPIETSLSFPLNESVFCLFEVRHGKQQQQQPRLVEDADLSVILGKKNSQLLQRID